ncbi:phage tail tube protein [Streptomyces sp. CNQ085]|uniref:phage tail tube protein n=1 Tax=Streptomyces sp. CNQ085 TaxID=2886944 RepID=UPI001F50A5EC|nr:phage tail tube protein [Streptomyces sp. CNQ085]MCI0384590.1 phage tail tube protein [Streptomyces sp. CNQ085]
MAGLDAQGTLLQRGDGGDPEAFTSIANLTDISPPSSERETHDVTTHQSPDKHREYIGGLVDGGEVSCDINYDPREHDSLRADFEDPDPRNYKIVWPGTLGDVEFAAVMTGFEYSAAHDGKLEGTITFQVSGKPTFNPGV